MGARELVGGRCGDGLVALNNPATAPKFSGPSMGYFSPVLTHAGTLKYITAYAAHCP